MFPVLWSPKLDTVFYMSSNEWQGIITSLDLLGMFLLIWTKTLLAFFLPVALSACCGLSSTRYSSPSPQS